MAGLEAADVILGLYSVAVPLLLLHLTKYSRPLVEWVQEGRHEDIGSRIFRSSVFLILCFLIAAVTVSAFGCGLYTVVALAGKLRISSGTTAWVYLGVLLVFGSASWSIFLRHAYLHRRDARHLLGELRSGHQEYETSSGGSSFSSLETHHRWNNDALDNLSGLRSGLLGYEDSSNGSASTFPEGTFGRNSENTTHNREYAESIERLRSNPQIVDEGHQIFRNFSPEYAESIDRQPSSLQIHDGEHQNFPIRYDARARFTFEVETPRSPFSSDVMYGDFRVGRERMSDSNDSNTCHEALSTVPAAPHPSDLYDYINITAPLTTFPSQGREDPIWSPSDITQYPGTYKAPEPTFDAVESPSEITLAPPSVQPKPPNAPRISHRVPPFFDTSSSEPKSIGTERNPGAGLLGGPDRINAAASSSDAVVDTGAYENLSQHWNLGHQLEGLENAFSQPGKLKAKQEAPSPNGDGTLDTGHISATLPSSIRYDEEIKKVWDMLLSESEMSSSQERPPWLSRHDQPS